MSRHRAFRRDLQHGTSQAPGQLGEANDRGMRPWSAEADYKAVPFSDARCGPADFDDGGYDDEEEEEEEEDYGYGRAVSAAASGGAGAPARAPSALYTTSWRRADGRRLVRCPSRSGRADITLDEYLEGVTLNEVEHGAAPQLSCMRSEPRNGHANAHGCPHYLPALGRSPPHVGHRRRARGGERRHGA